MPPTPVQRSGGRRGLRALRVLLAAVWQPCLGARVAQPSRTPRAQPGYQLWKTATAHEVAPEPVPQQALPPCQPAAGAAGAPASACLPRFLVIGNQKSATSTLYQILRTHPQVLPAAAKELLFFRENLGRVHCSPPSKFPTPLGFASYLRNFPRTFAGDDRLTGEFSATYLNCWCCPQAFKRLMPSVRMVVQLRDPIERALSRWTEQHTKFKLIPTYGSFEEYVERELPALQACLGKARGSLQVQVWCGGERTVLGVSLYDSALKLWLQKFRPSDLLVTYLEQFAVQPKAVLEAIHSHLGLRSHEYSDELLHSHYNAKGNYGWGAKRALLQANASATMEKLYQFYRPQMVELKRMADARLISKLPATWVARWRL